MHVRNEGTPLQDATQATNQGSAKITPQPLLHKPQSTTSPLATVKASKRGSTAKEGVANSSSHTSYGHHYNNIKPQDDAGAEPDMRRYGPLVSGNNPDFINQYYSQSRLHVLSTAGNEAKAFVRTKQKEAITQGKVIKDFSVQNAVGRVIVHIDLDAFFCSVGLRDRPELVDQAVAVAHSKTGGSSDVSSCNYIARKHGIRNGTSTRRALEACPELKVRISCCTTPTFHMMSANSIFVDHSV
jgi:hypothetical protein